jgi:hypothetical protein
MRLQPRNLFTLMTGRQTNGRRAILLHLTQPLHHRVRLDPHLVVKLSDLESGKAELFKLHLLCILKHHAPELT